MKLAREFETADMDAENKKEKPQEEAVAEGAGREETAGEAAAGEETPAEAVSGNATDSDILEEVEKEMHESGGEEAQKKENSAEEVPEQAEPSDKSNVAEEETEEKDSGKKIEEEIILDDEPVTEEFPAAQDASTAASESEGTETAGKGQEKTDEKADESPKPAHTGKGIIALFRRKRVLLSTACAVVLLGLVFGYRYMIARPKQGTNLFASYQEKGGDMNGLVRSVLRPFFIPLPAGAGDVALKLDLTVQWGPENLLRYKKRVIRIRNEVYQYLLHAVKSGKGLGKKYSGLESVLNLAFQHSLAVKDIKVHIDKITPL